MLVPLKGVDDVFAAVTVLLAGIHPDISVTKTGKVKSRTWDDAKQSMLKNVGGLVDILKAFKIGGVDAFTVFCRFIQVRILQLLVNRHKEQSCSWTMKLGCKYCHVLRH